MNKARLILPMRAAEHDPVNTQTLDISGNGNNGVFAGTPTKLSTKGYSFTVAQHLDTTVVPSGIGSMGVVFQAPLANRSVMGSAVAGSAPRAYLYINASGIICGGVASHNLATIVGSSYVTDNCYHSVVLTWDGIFVRLSIDGISEYYAAQSGGMVGCNPIYVGDINMVSAPFGGSVFDAFLLDTAMTQLQIIDYHQRIMEQINDV